MEIIKNDDNFSIMLNGYLIVLIVNLYTIIIRLQIKQLSLYLTIIPDRSAHIVI